MSRPLFLLLIAFAALIQSGWGSWQYSDAVGDFFYTATYDQTAGGAYEGTARITGYTGSATHVVIPESVTFTANPSGLQSVTVNCMVTAIQQNFGQPGVFADKLEIKTVSFPSALRYIGISSFEGCTGLETLSIPPNVTSIDGYAFADCSSLGTINNLGIVAIPGNVTDIGYYAFKGCTGIKTLILDEGVSNLEESAFGDCTALTNVMLPASINSMGSYNGSWNMGVFKGCSSLATVTIAKGADIGRGAFFRCANLSQVNFVGSSNPANTGSIGEGAFGECLFLDNLVLADGIVHIGNGAFVGCTSLQSVSIPASLVSWNGAFSGCSSLKNVTLADGVQSIADNAFKQCGSLETMLLRASVTSIGKEAFSNCYKIATINNTSNLTAIGERAFEGCTSLKSPIFPPNVTDIEIATYAGCTSLEDFVFPPSITKIGSSAFTNCYSLTSVTIPSTVTEIGDSPFAGCGNVTEAYYPPNATSIGSTFSQCFGLANVMIPLGVTTIGESAFSWCWELSKVTIPSGVTRIDSTAFAYCKKLNSITIPAGVQTVGYAAFLGCETLVSAYFLGPAPSIGTRCFEASPTTIYYLPGADGFTSPVWQGYPAFPMIPYGGVVPDLASQEAHLLAGNPADGNVTIANPITTSAVLVQRQTTPVTLDMESSRILRLGTTGTVRIEAGYGGLAIGKIPGDGFLTAGGVANAPGTLILDNASTNDLTIHSVISNNGSGVVGLSKTGGGKAVLAAMNTYSGNTAITGGSLVLKSPCLTDASAVTITAGSTLNLDYTGADIVSSLTLNGTTQANGLYYSSNTRGIITGTGKLQVGPFPSYNAWTTANAPGQAKDQDHDHDGVPNGVEYFMGKSGSDFTANPGIAADGTVTWPKSAAFSGSYSVQTSENLKDWVDVTEDADQVTRNPDLVIWTRPDGPERRFVRLLVNPN